MTTPKPPTPGDQRRELREAILKFDKSRGETGADYVTGKITRLQADSEYEDDIARLLDLVDTHIAAQVREARIDELQITKSSIRKGQGLLGGQAVMRCEEMRQWLNNRIAELQRLADKEKS